MECNNRSNNGTLHCTVQWLAFLSDLPSIFLVDGLKLHTLQAFSYIAAAQSSYKVILDQVREEVEQARAGFIKTFF